MIVLEREMRTAARAITDCTRFTPADVLMAEVGLVPVETRKKFLVARLLAKACALPDEDPLRHTTEASKAGRLKTVRGWRRLGREMWEAVEVAPQSSPSCRGDPPPMGGMR